MPRPIKVLTFLLIVLPLAGCANRSQLVTQPPPANTSTNNKAEIKLTSSAFSEGQPIPRAYTCDGVNISPPLEWSGVPKTARTIAIVCDDPDAPGGTWVHWVLYNLPAENIGLVENLPATENVKAGGFQGQNDFGKSGYGGPCPPSGTHRYYFKIFAFDRELDLPSGAKRGQLDAAMKGHVVAQGELMGRYSRKK